MRKGIELLRVEHLKYIITISNLGSINKASKALFINQQQLSKIVHNLEEELGVKIFNRYSNGVELTTEGKAVYEAANNVVKTMDELYMHLNRQVNLKGDLDIKASLSYWDQNIVYQTYDKFVMLYPNVNISINELSSGKILNLCGKNEDIIGFVSLADSPLVTEKVEIPENCIFIQLCDYSLGILVSKDNNFAKANKVVSLDSLKDEDFVVYAIDGESSFDYYLSKAGNKKYSVSKISRFYEIIRKNKAIALGINRGEKFFKEMDIKFVPLKENIVATSGLVVSKKYQQKPLIKTFVDLCKKQQEEMNDNFVIKV